MSTQAISIMVLIALALGWLVGYVVGQAQGRDAQWVDDYLDAARKDRERRDERGRWKRRAAT
jgi:hypothetical protein